MGKISCIVLQQIVKFWGMGQNNHTNNVLNNTLNIAL